MRPCTSGRFPRRLHRRFVAQISATGDTRVFALVVLPIAFALGIFTFVRLVERPSRTSTTGVINRIRSYYLGAGGPEARWFMLAGHDDAPGVLRNMARRRRGVSTITASSAIAVVNSVVGGAARDRVLGRVRCVPGASAVMGATFAPLSVITHLRWSRRHWRQASPRTCSFPARALTCTAPSIASAHSRNSPRPLSQLEQVPVRILEPRGVTPGTRGSRVART